MKNLENQLKDIRSVEQSSGFSLQEEESLENLHSMIEEKRLEIDSNRIKILENEQKKKVLYGNLDLLYKDISRLNAEKSSIQVKMENRESMKQEMNSICKEISRVLGSFDNNKILFSVISESLGDSLCDYKDIDREVMDPLIYSLREKLDLIKTDFKSQESKIMKDKQDAISHVFKTVELRSSKERKLEELTDMKTNISSEIQGINLDEKRLLLEELATELRTQEEILEGLKNDLNDGNFSDQIGSLETELRKVEDAMIQKNEILKNISKANEERSKNSERRRTIWRLSERLFNIIEENKAGIRKCLSDDENISRLDACELSKESAVEDKDSFHNLKDIVKSAIDFLTKQIRKDEKQISCMEVERKEIEKDLVVVESEYGMIKEQILKKEKERVCKYKTIQNILGINDGMFDISNISEIFREKQREMKESMKYSRCEEIYADFLQTVEKNNSCPVCFRDFLNKEDSERTISGIHDKMSRDYPNNEKDLKRVEILLEELENIEDCEIHILFDSKAETETRLERLKEDFSNIEKRISSSQGCFDAKSLFLSLRTCMEYLEEIEEVLNSLSFNSVIGEASLYDDIYDQIEECQEESHTIRSKIELVHRRHRELLSSAQTSELDVRDTRSRHLLCVSSIDSAERLVEKLYQTEYSITYLEREIKSLDEDIVNIEKNVVLFEEALKKNEERTSRICDIYYEKIIKLEQSVSRYYKIQDDLEGDCDYGDFDSINHRLRESNDQLDCIHLDIEDCEKSISCLRNKNDNDMQAEKRILCNIRLVKLISTEKRYIEELCNVRSQLDILTCNKILVDGGYVDPCVQNSLLRESYTHLVSKKSVVVGETKQLKNELVKKMEELQRDYGDIKERHKNQFLSVKTSELALEDLSSYAKAVDNAIMKYHSIKMDEINRIIRELWINTYQGNDIDTIEIRSDEEVSKINRSYNYRVVMIKNGVDLDMRGRSSAGQKVLTSIIIRLALAETFGLSCGVLALDEPTTNLDHANIEKLAESLLNLIRIRSKQNNFQLIIISHDEDFINLLGQSEFVTHYWRVSRNHNQHSVIERQSLYGKV